MLQERERESGLLQKTEENCSRFPRNRDSLSLPSLTAVNCYHAAYREEKSCFAIHPSLPCFLAASLALEERGRRRRRWFLGPPPPLAGRSLAHVVHGSTKWREREREREEGKRQQQQQQEQKQADVCGIANDATRRQEQRRS